MIYPSNQYSSYSEGKLKRILNKKIQHNCNIKFSSLGGPIILKSNNKVIGFLRREITAKKNKFYYHEGTFIKFPFEEFIKKYNKEINNDTQNNYISSNNMNNENNNMDNKNNNTNNHNK